MEQLSVLQERDIVVSSIGEGLFVLRKRDTTTVF
jgi:hypothetical protein